MCETNIFHWIRGCNLPSLKKRMISLGIAHEKSPIVQSHAIPENHRQPTGSPQPKQKRRMQMNVLNQTRFRRSTNFSEDSGPL
jgi:hypothetical protein